MTIFGHFGVGSQAVLIFLSLTIVVDFWRCHAKASSEVGDKYVKWSSVHCFPCARRPVINVCARVSSNPFLIASSPLSRFCCQLLTQAARARTEHKVGQGHLERHRRLLQSLGCRDPPRQPCITVCTTHHRHAKLQKPWPSRLSSCSPPAA